MTDKFHDNSAIMHEGSITTNAHVIHFVHICAISILSLHDNTLAARPDTSTQSEHGPEICFLFAVPLIRPRLHHNKQQE